LKITVFGVGYVGLVQAAALAEVGHDVLCIDVDEAKICRLRNGEVPIYEPGLAPLVSGNSAAGRLAFSSSAAEGVAHARVQFIAVGTPPQVDGAADISNVLTVAAAIGRHTETPQTIITKSTVPVGTGDRIRAVVGAALAARGADGLGIEVVSNPEFLKEGSAVADCMRPDRIVVGSSSEAATALLRDIYAPFNRNHEKMIVMDVRSAELTKYAANGMLATKISFMNEMANIAERLGADIEMVRQGIGSDPRIGYHFIYAGAGYGGSCFPKDVRALIHAARGAGFEATLLEAVEARNEAQKHVVFAKIAARLGEDLKGKAIALWGLAFKPNTDDMRSAPSRTLMESLWRAGATVRAFDPAAAEECRISYGERPDLVLCDSKYEALRGAAALVIMTDWRSFQAPDFDEMKSLLAAPLIFDGRNLFNPATMARLGIEYHAVGRGVVADSPAA
jgi:UDPglucose 6-dehydrogenase